MAEARFDSERGKQVLFIDLTHNPGLETVLSVVREATGLAPSSSGPGSLRTLLDLTGTPVTRPILSSLKSLSRKNGRYAKATAFVDVKRVWSLA